LGARNIDYILFEIFATEFSKKHGCNLHENPKGRLRMLDAIERMRKLLTANKEADIDLDSLMDEKDFHIHFTRD